MPMHFRNTVRESDSTVAATVRRNLNLPADDQVDDGDMTVADCLDEAAGRLGAVRDEVDESDGGVSAESIEFAIEPLRQACAQIRSRANDESEPDADDAGPRRGPRTENNDFLTPALRKEQMAMRRRCIAEGQSGVVVSHITR